MKPLIGLLFSMYCLNCNAQRFSVQIMPELNIITADELNPPYTAGADYSERIELDAKGIISLTEIREGVSWCLSARNTATPIGVATIVLQANYTSVNLDQWDPNSPIKTELSGNYKAVFSGIGPVENLEINFTLEGATLAQDWQPRSENILWTVENGGCLK